MLQNEFESKLDLYKNDTVEKIDNDTINHLIRLCQSEYEEVVYAVEPDTGNKKDLTLHILVLECMLQVLLLLGLFFKV